MTTPTGGGSEFDALRAQLLLDFAEFDAGMIAATGAVDALERTMQAASAAMTESLTAISAAAEAAATSQLTYQELVERAYIDAAFIEQKLAFETEAFRQRAIIQTTEIAQRESLRTVEIEKRRADELVALETKVQLRLTGIATEGARGRTFAQERVNRELFTAAGGALGGIEGSRAGRLAGSILQVGSAAQLAAVSVGVLAAVSVHFATDFDARMAKIKGLTEQTGENFDDLRNAVLKLAPAVGKSPKELADALYFIESDGIHAKDAIDLLTISAKAAAAGLGTTAQVSRTVSSTFNAYRETGLSAKNITDQITAAVTEGHIQSETFAQNLGKIVGQAGALKIPLTEVLANVATLTRTSGQTPFAVTSFQAMLQGLIKLDNATPKQITAFHDLGLTAGQFNNVLTKQGLHAGLELIANAFDATAKKGGNAAGAIQRLFPNIRASRDVLGSAIAQSGAYAEILGKIKAASDGVGRTEEAFAVRQQTLAQRFAELKAGAEAGSIAIGHFLTPYILQGITDAGVGLRAAVNEIERFGPVLSPIIPIFHELVNSVQHLIAALTPVLEGLVAAAFVTLYGALLVVVQVLSGLSVALNSVAHFLDNNRGLVVALATVIGALLIPRLVAAAATGFIEFLAGVRAGMASVTAGAVEEAVALQGLTASSAAGVTAGSRLATVGSTLGGALKTLVSPAGLAAVGIGLLAYGFYSAHQHAQELKKSAENLTKTIGQIPELTNFIDPALFATASQSSIDHLTQLQAAVQKVHDTFHDLVEVSGKVALSPKAALNDSDAGKALPAGVDEAAKAFRAASQEAARYGFETKHLSDVTAQSSDQLKSNKTAIDSAKAAQQQYTDILSGANREFGLNEHSTASLISRYQQLTGHTLDLKQPTEAIVADLGKVAAATRGASAGAESTAANMSVLKDQTASATSELQAFKAELDTALGKPTSRLEAQRQFNDALADFNTKLRAAGGSLDDQSKAGAAAADSLGKLQTAQKTLADTSTDIGQTGRTYESTAKRISGAIDGIKPSFGKFDASAKQVFENLLPGHIKKVVDALDSADVNQSATEGGKTAGTNFAQGMQQGLTGFDFAEGAHQTVSNLKNAIAIAQRSKSPAKEAMPLGKDFAEGYAVGLGLAIDKIRERAGDLVKATKGETLKALRGSIQEMQDAFTTTFAGTGNVLSSALSALNDGVNGTDFHNALLRAGESSVDQARDGLLTSVNTLTTARTEAARQEAILNPYLANLVTKTKNARDRQKELNDAKDEEKRKLSPAQDALRAARDKLATAERNKESAATIKALRGEVQARQDNYDKIKKEQDASVAAAKKRHDASVQALADAKQAAAEIQSDADAALSALADATKAAADAQQAVADAVFSAAQQQASGVFGVVKDSLDRILAEANKFRGDFQSAVLEGTDLKTLFQVQGSEGVQSANDVLATLKQKIQDASNFAKDVGALAGRGLNEAILDQIDQAGPIEGEAIAQQLLGDPSLIDQFDDVAGQLTTIATTGVQGAVTGYYGAAAKQLGQFVSGLAAQFPQLGSAFDEIQAEIGQVLGTTPIDTLSGLVQSPLSGGGASKTYTFNSPITINGSVDSDVLAQLQALIDSNNQQLLALLQSSGG